MFLLDIFHKINRKKLSCGLPEILRTNFVLMELFNKLKGIKLINELLKVWLIFN